MTDARHRRDLVLELVELFFVNVAGGLDRNRGRPAFSLVDSPERPFSELVGLLDRAVDDQRTTAAGIKPGTRKDSPLKK